MAGLKLYEISNAVIEAQAETVNTDELNALQIAFQDKAIGCACVVKNLNAEVTAIDAEIKRLIELKTARQNNVDRLKAYLLSCMQAAGIDRVENGVHKLRIQKSPLSVQVLDEDSVPTEFKTEVREIRVDKKRIAEYIKQSGEIPSGCDAKHNDHLRIS